MTETWNLLIQAARAAEKRDPGFSEGCLRQALRSAELFCGVESAEAGLCLMELSDFLERAGRQEEADELSARYCAILTNYAKSLGISA